MVIFCIGNEKSFTFMEDVLAEVIDLFPSEYIHVGGDEREVCLEEMSEMPGFDDGKRNEERGRASELYDSSG